MKQQKFWLSWRGELDADVTFPCWERRTAAGSTFFALITAPGIESAWAFVEATFGKTARLVGMPVIDTWAPCPMKFRNSDRVDLLVNA